jgi:membrane protein implicated in regulation of membrane protease activity
MDFYQISLVIGVILAIIELFTYTFIFLSFSVAFIAIAFIQYLNNDFSLNREIILFTTISLVFVFIFRKLFKKKIDQKILITDDINIY